MDQSKPKDLIQIAWPGRGSTSRGLRPAGVPPGCRRMMGMTCSWLLLIRRGRWQVEVVLQPRVRLPVALALEKLLDLRSLWLFVIVFYRDRPELVLVEGKAEQCLQFGPFDIQTHEMNERRCVRATQNVAERHGGQFHFPGLFDDVLVAIEMT